MTRLEELTKSLQAAHAKEMWTLQRKAFAAHILASDYRTNLTFNEWLAEHPELAGPDFETWLVGEAICGNGEADELLGLREMEQKGCSCERCTRLKAIEALK